MDIKKIALFLVCCMFTSVGFTTQVYMWVDEQGVAHYSQFEPRELAADQLDYSGERSAKDELTKPLPSTQQFWLEQAREERLNKQAAKQRQEATEQRDKAFKQYCQKLEKSLAVLKRGGQVRQKDKQGEFRYLPEEERVKTLHDSQARFDKHCL